MVQFLKPLAYGMTAAALLCSTALVAPSNAAGQKADQQQQQQVQQKPAVPKAATNAASNGATEGKQGERKAPVASPRTFSSPERLEARVAELQQKLKITGEQKPQWDKVVAAMRDNADSIEDVLAHRRQNAGKMSAIEDMQSYQTLSEKHAEGLKNMVAAFGPLYESLSPEQKKAADSEFSGYRKRVAGTGKTK